MPDPQKEEQKESQSTREVKHTNIFVTEIPEKFHTTQIKLTNTDMQTDPEPQKLPVKLTDA